MNKVRTLVALFAALAVPSVYADEAKPAGSGDGEWGSQYGMIFSVQNVFQNNSAAVIGDFSGGVGLQYNLAPQRALRISLGLSRASNPSSTVKTTNIATGATTEDFVAPGSTTPFDTTDDFTSKYDANLGALYVMRLAPSAIAPYFGFGGGIGYHQQAMNYQDDITDPNLTFKVDNMDRSFSLNAAGTLGVEWRVHKSIALFAEYGVGLDLVTYTSSSEQQTTTVNATGARSGFKSEGSKTKWFNFDTGLGQGGQIGLVAFF